MAHTQTSGTTRKDILSAIKTFATANGWTATYDDISASGNLGLTKGNCAVALTDGGTTTPVDAINGGTVTDGFIFCALGTSLTLSNKNYFGHPGSIAATAGAGNGRCTINDLAGPFSNIWLYANSTGDYIHVVIQSSSSRYTYFGFGTLNMLGQTVSPVAFLVTTQWGWWPNATPVTASNYSPNNPAAFSAVSPGNTSFQGHQVGFLWETSTQERGFHLRIPAGVLDGGAGFTTTDRCIASFVELAFNRVALLSQGAQSGLISGGSIALPCDAIMALPNVPTTGGATLWSVPCLFSEAATPSPGIYTHLGDLPDFRLTAMGGLNAQDTYTIGSDSWQVFPWKHKDIFSNTRNGATPTQFANSINYGIAIKII